jgi:hypothetical protein
LPRPNSSMTTIPTMTQCQMLAPPMAILLRRSRADAAFGNSRPT